MADLSDDIETNAGNPKRVTVAGETAEQQPLPDQIAADKYLARKTAAARTGLPIRVGVLRPPGAV
jgi:hypothetical protein